MNKKNKKCPGTAEEALKSKSWRKQTSLELNFLFNSVWAGLDFEIEYLTEP